MQAAKHIEKPLAVLHEALRHAPIVLLAINQSGEFLLVEGGGLSSWRADHPPHLGQSMYDLLEDSPELLEGFEKALAGQVQWCRTYIGDRVFALHFSPVAADGSATIRACCMAQDITEQAESDRQRIEQLLTLFEQERRMSAGLRALIEGLPLGIVVTRADQVLFLNVAARTCLRWPDSGDYLGQVFSQFLPSSSQSRLREHMDGAPELIHFGELQVVTGDG